jgi:Holliday junction resolvase-like predicted endonuclease
MPWFTRLVARFLGSASRHFGQKEPEHLAVARRGETEAYLYLRDRGYRIVAKNFRAPHNRGEIDLIGWDHGALCFVEVKTHAHAGLVARRYVRRLPGDKSPPCRFDIVSVVLGEEKCKPTIRLHKGAFSWTTGRHVERESRYLPDRKRWWRR